MHPTSKITAAIFDFDGVIADTEPQYDTFFNNLAAKYRLPTNFAALIKGTTLTAIMEKYFSAYSPEERAQITRDHLRYELQMTYTFIPGAREAIHYFKNNGYQTAIVTSSPTAKMNIALQKMQLENTFDALITADHITRGKPDPMCYRLAAATLGVAPAACVVFEDSLMGIAAGKNAGMKVIGLATTVPAATLAQHVENSIPDFSDLQKVRSLLE
jgi:HAD superfamily hydrolase (TIGR01509 family)